MPANGTLRKGWSVHKISGVFGKEDHGAETPLDSIWKEDWRSQVFLDIYLNNES